MDNTVKFYKVLLTPVQVSLVGTDLVIVNVSRADAGTYTCELDTDDLTPLAVSHTLQILGGCGYVVLHKSV